MARKSAHTKKRSGARYLRLENLEKRQLLAAVVWTGNGDAVSWTDSGNWNTGIVPGLDDDVTINIATDPTIRIDSGHQRIKSLASDEAIVVSGSATLDLSNASSINNAFSLVDQSTLGGSGDLTISGAVEWRGGAMIGAGKTVLTPNAPFTFAGGQLNRTIETYGSTLWTEGDMRMESGTFRNFGEFVVDSTESFLLSYGTSIDSLNVFDNQGTFIKHGPGVGGYDYIAFGDVQGSSGIRFENHGTVEIEQGQLALLSGAFNTAASTYNIAANGYLHLENDVIHVAGSTINNAGLLVLGGSQHVPAGTLHSQGRIVVSGTVSLASPLSTHALEVSGVVDIQGDVNVAELQLSGTLDASGDISVSENMEWTYGTLAGSGTATLSPNATLAFRGGKLEQTFETYGSTLWASGDMQMENGTFRNFGEMIVDSTTTFLYSYGTGVDSENVFDNQGTLIKRGSNLHSYNYVSFHSNASGSGIRFENDGRIDIESGAIGVGAGGYFGANTIVSISADGTLDLYSDATYAAGAFIGSSGVVSFSAGVHDLPPNMIVSNGQIDVNSTVNFASPLTTPKLRLQTLGSLGYAGDVTVTEHAQFFGGTITGTGNTIIGESAEFNVNGIILHANDIINHGEMHLYAGRLTLGGSLVNTGVINSGSYEIVGDSDDAKGKLENQGTLRVLRDSLQPLLINNLDLNNDGSIEVFEASLSLHDSHLTGTGTLRTQRNSVLEFVEQGSMLGSTQNVDRYAGRGLVRIVAAGTSEEPFELEVMGEDRGPVSEGTIRNFAFGVLEIGQIASYVKLVDNSDNSIGTSDEAFYVDTLAVAADSTLDLNGLKLYARVMDVRGTILNGEILQIPDGGTITVNSTASGLISSIGEVDEWTFYGRVGQTVSLLAEPARRNFLTPIDPAVDWLDVTILDSSSAVLSTESNSVAGDPVLLLGSRIQRDGEHTIRVKTPVTHGTSVGNYHLSLNTSSSDEFSLIPNETVVGVIEAPFNIDRWSFFATTATQVQFDWINSSTDAIQFRLLGPNGWVGFDSLRGDSELLTLPFSGLYTLEVYTNGTGTGSYAMALRQSAQTTLDLDVTYEGVHQGDETSQLFKVEVPRGKRLLINLDDPAATHRNDVYVKYALPPTREEFQYRSSSAGASQSVFVPAAAEGTWYILVYSEASSADAPFSLTASASTLYLTELTPKQSSRSSETRITLRGAGFSQATTVTLVASDGSETPAAALTVDTATQVTATFPADTFDAGTYTVRVANEMGDAAEITDAFQFLESSTGGEFWARLNLPSEARLRAVTGLSLEYANEGDEPIPAPILTIRGSDRALLTTDANVLRQGAWSGTATPDRFTESLQIIAQGSVPGLLGPGERITIPFWVIPQSGDTLNFTLDTLSPSDQGLLNWTTPLERFVVENWENPFVGYECMGSGCNIPPPRITEVWTFVGNEEELRKNDKWTGSTSSRWSTIKETVHFADPLETALKPDALSQEAWDVVLPNLRAMVGETWGDYVQALSRNAEYLGRLGLHVTDVGELWSFMMQQAIGLTPVSTLGAVTDARVELPGNDLTLSRHYLPTLIGRNEIGVFGRGWVLGGGWDNRLTLEPETGIVVIASADGSQRRFQPDVRGGFFSANGDFAVLTQEDEGYLLHEKHGTLTRYGVDGHVDYVEDTNGNRITATFADGRLVGLSHPSGNATLEYNESGRVIKITDSTGLESLFTYDASNELLVSVLTSNGKQTLYTYETDDTPAVQHALASIVSTGDIARRFTYDALGRLSSVKQCDCDTPGGETTTYQYELGRIIAQDAIGNETETFLDHRGRVTKSVDPLGNAIYFAYDKSNNLTVVMDAASQAYNFAYDKSGNLVETFNPLGVTNHYTYDGPFGKLTKAVDGRGNATSYGYDIDGNNTEVVFADGSVSRFRYNDAGDLVGTTNRRLQLIENKYDAQGRISSRTFPDGSQESFTYDSRGNLTRAETGGQVTSISYNVLKRPTRIEYPNGRWIEHTYDAEGRRIQQEDHSGFIVKYAYGTNGRLSELRDVHESRIVSYQYDSAGRVTREDKGNSTFTTYEYDAAGRAKRIIHHAPNGSAHATLTYQYNERGELITASTNDGQWDYTYDSLGQLIRAQLLSSNPAIANRDLHYEYDAVGNRVRTLLNGAETIYVTNPLNQLTNAGETTYHYDADGNVVKEVGPRGIRTYTFNAQNQLVTSTTPEGISQYEYDTFGNRTAMVTDGERMDFLIDLIGFGNVIGEYDNSGVRAVSFAHGNGLESSFYQSDVGYFDFSAIGSTIGVTGQNGTYVSEYSYEPFGNLISRREDVSTPHTFIGELGVQDDGNGLSFMRARYYDGNIGRFLSVDPIDQLTRDHYIYAQNSPLNFVDPLGLAGVNAGGGVGGLLGIAGLATGVALLAEGGSPNDRLVAGTVMEGNTGTGFENYAGIASSDAIGYINEAAFGFGVESVLGGVTRNLAGELFGRFISGPGWDSPYSPLPNLILALPPSNGEVNGSIPVPAAKDPNQKLGPNGAGEENFVASGALLAYRIDFENDATATAPAQRVTVSDPLSSDLDLDSFEFTEVGFGDFQLSIPAESSRHVRTTIEYTVDGHTMLVSIELGIRSKTREAYAIFQSIDPTSDLPPNGSVGFLPPEDGSGRGLGYFTYAIAPVADLPSGTAIRNVANITFDEIERIDTNQIDPHDPSAGTDPTKEALVTIDAASPTSSVNAISAQSPAVFEVIWTGTDDVGGSGISSFDIYVSVNNAPFTLWLDDTALTRAEYVGIPGQTVRFLSRAKDLVGHEEAEPTTPDATTTLATLLSLDAGDNQTSMVGLYVGLDSVSFTSSEVIEMLSGIVDWGDGTQNSVSLLRVDEGVKLINTHTYAAVGQYTATLSLADSTGNSASDTFRVTIIEPTHDYGDAGQNYPVLFEQNGARHAVGELFLGSLVTAEANGLHSGSADADGASDDGVQFLTTLLANADASTQSSIKATASLAGKLDAWIDFNQDGDWLDDGEQLFTAVNVVAGDENILSFTIPAGALPGPTYARFRLSTAGGLSPTGEAPVGEVEDYITTLFASNNATVNVTSIIPGTVTIETDDTNVVVRAGESILFQGPATHLAVLDFTGSSGDDAINLTTKIVDFTGGMSVDAGVGMDTVILGQANSTLVLTTGSSVTLVGTEVLDIRGTDKKSLTLDEAAIGKLADNGHTPRVLADPMDTIKIVDGGFSITGTLVETGQIVVQIQSTPTGGGAAARLEIVGKRWTNPIEPTDVTGTGGTTAIDALRIINQLNSPEVFDPDNGVLRDPATVDISFEFSFFDVSGDGVLSAVDALRVINRLNELDISGEPIRSCKPIVTRQLAPQQNAVSPVTSVVLNQVDQPLVGIDWTSLEEDLELLVADQQLLSNSSRKVAVVDQQKRRSGDRDDSDAKLEMTLAESLVNLTTFGSIKHLSTGDH